jgi:hypothetical protein
MRHLPNALHALAYPTRKPIVAVQKVVLSIVGFRVVKDLGYIGAQILFESLLAQFALGDAREMDHPETVVDSNNFRLIGIVPMAKNVNDSTLICELLAERANVGLHATDFAAARGHQRAAMKTEKGDL